MTNEKKKNILFNFCLTAGVILLVSGLFLLIDDSMSSSWCSPKKSSFSIKKIINGWWVLITGILFLTFPVYKSINDGRKKN